jgi:glycine cleavage system H protein
MSVPNDRRYLQTHEWHKRDGDIITIGITQFAADELTDVTYVSLPKVGDQIEPNSRFGEVESVKATSDLYAGIGGEVAEVNDALSSNPGLVNSDPFGQGWMIKIRAPHPENIDNLLSAEDYLNLRGHG